MSDMGDILPPNRTPLESAFSTACISQLDPRVIPKLWDASTCTTDLLPWLAWTSSVEEWSDIWDEAAKRKTVKSSIEIHRKKGTVWAVKHALSTLDVKAELIEWWQQQPMGEPYTFAMIAWVTSNSSNGVPILNQGMYDRLRRIVNQVKPVRAHYTFKLGALFNQENITIASTQQVAALGRWHVAARPVQPNPAVQALRMVNVQQASAVARVSVEPLPVQPTVSNNSLRLASAARPLSVIRVAMEVQ